MIPKNKSIFSFKDENRSSSKNSSKPLLPGSTLSGLESSPVKLEDIGLLKGTSSTSRSSRFIEGEPNSGQIKPGAIQLTDPDNPQARRTKNLNFKISLDEVADQIFLDLKSSTPRTNRDTPKTNRESLLQPETPDVAKHLAFLKKEDAVSPLPSESILPSNEILFESLVDTPVGVTTRRRRDMLRILSNMNSRRSTATLVPNTFAEAPNTFTDYVQSQSQTEDPVSLERIPFARDSKKAMSSFADSQRVNLIRQSSRVSQNKANAKDRDKDNDSSIASLELDLETKPKGNGKLETLHEVHEGGTLLQIQPHKEK